MAQEILTPLQRRFIRLFAADKTLQKQFYLTGGTALAAYYLKHRYSEDLDFFSYESVDMQSYNRNIFFLHAKKEILKTEFTYFPFEQVETPLRKDGVAVDSLVDLAVNKAFTISQNPRARDFIDLYFILARNRKYTFEKLLKLARAKFDAQIDPLQLGTQLLKAKNIQDIPRMANKIDHSVWRNYFVGKAKSLSKEIFK